MEKARNCGETYGGGRFVIVWRPQMATKNIKIKIHRGLRWLQNDMKNATINQKRAALMDERWDVTSER